MRWLTLVCALLLTGCLYPRLPYSSHQELIDHGTALVTPLTVEDARKMVIGLHDRLFDAQAKRDLQVLVSQEIAFYGTLVAVGGIAFDSRAARNFGSGIAGLTSVLTTHYRPADQSAAFRKAAERAECLVEAFRPLDPSLRASFAQIVEKQDGLPLAYSQIPAQTVEFVDKISADLYVALNGISLAAPTKDDLAKTMETWKDKKNTSPDPVDASDLAHAKTTMVGMSLMAVGGTPAVDDAKVTELLTNYLAAIKDFKADGDACLVQHTQ